jgi:hypothetical protein
MSEILGKFMNAILYLAVGLARFAPGGLAALVCELHDMDLFTRGWFARAVFVFRPNVAMSHGSSWFVSKGTLWPQDFKFKLQLKFVLFAESSFVFVMWRVPPSMPASPLKPLPFHVYPIHYLVTSNTLCHISVDQSNGTEQTVIFVS